MYEHHSEPLLPTHRFLRRLVSHVFIGLLLLACSLGMGIFGYHFTEELPWIDSLLNASMILGGMGPVNPIVTAAGKFFASFYALFSGIIVLAVAGIMIAPVAHRIMHRLHLSSGDEPA